MREIEANVSDGEASNFTDQVFSLVQDGTLSAAQAQDLEWMWNLRNLLTHEDVDGSDVARALLGSVRAAERIRNHLVGRVPTVRGMLGDVAMAKPEDSVAETAELMAKEDYSCLPLEIDGRVVGAIDADVILRWMGSNLQEVGLLEDVTLGQIRDQAAGPRIEFMRTDCAQRTVARAFTGSLDDRGPLAAVVLTSDGSDAGLVRGIVTPWDVAGLHT